MIRLEIDSILCSHNFYVDFYLVFHLLAGLMDALFCQS